MPARAGSDTYFPSEEHSGVFSRPVTESVTARAGGDTDFPSGEHSDVFSRPVTESVTAWAGSDTDFPSEEHSEFFGRSVTGSVTAWAGSDTDFPRGEHSEVFSRPVTESMAARAGSDTDFPSEEHSEFFGRLVTESGTERAGSDTDFPNGEYSAFVDRPVTESVTARAADTEQILVMNGSAVTTEQSELREIVLGESDKRGIPVYRIECTPEGRRPDNIPHVALQHVEMSNNQRNGVNYCCGVCGIANSVNRSGTGSCWKFCRLIVGGYRGSGLAAIVIKDRLYGINLFTEDLRVFTGGPGLVCNPVTPCDVIRVYKKMNGNFKGGMDNMLLRSDDPVDSRYLQWRADDGHRSLKHESVPGKPIREKGRFGCVNAMLIGWSITRSVPSRSGRSELTI